MRILISNNSRTMASIADMMRQQGFLVSAVADGAAILEHLQQGRFDAVLIAPDLSDINAMQLVRRIQAQHKSLPVCLFSREWDRAEHSRALASGADYVAEWPFDGAEIASRIRAYARRAQGFAEPVIALGDLTLDIDQRILRLGGRSIHLNRLEYELMEMLALANGRLVSREAIMAKLYAGNHEPEARIIDTYISRIRSKLATLGAPERLISTHVDGGYRIDAFAALDTLKSA